MRLSVRARLMVAFSCLPLMAAADADLLPASVASGLEGVVSLRVREVVKVPTFSNGRFLSREVEGIGAGSGVVISEDGLILTNAHVVAGSQEVQVGFASGKTAAARLLAVDEASDLALLVVAETGLKAIPFAKGNRPPPGSPAFVVGNREGQGHEIAWARIGPHRRIRVGARPLEFWAEVEALVGPGNSGGAVLNMKGELLGIPSLLVRYTEERAGPIHHSSGLYIPVAHVRRSINRMLNGPRAAWPWLGLLLDDPLLAAAEGRAWIDDDRPVVRRVFPGSPAEEAGLRPGDRIISVGSRPIDDLFDALDAVLDLKIGDGIPVEIERNGMREMVGVVAAKRPDDPRPDPLDDFMLHTGLRLTMRVDGNGGRASFVFDGMSPEARAAMPAIEIDLFAERPLLASLLPGGDLLQGKQQRLPAGTAEDLAALLARCFVREQFVAMGHWSLGAGRTLDRAQVHRKIYPFVI